MDKSDRFSQLDRLFDLQKILCNRFTPISRADLQEELDCSRSTLTRLISLCRNYLSLPIKYNAEQQGYYLEKRNGKAQELPGLWFSAAEIHGLLTSHRLLSGIRPGLFEPHIQPLRERLEALLKHRHAGDRAIFERVRILPMAPREPRLEDFQTIASALVSRRRLRIKYRSRGKDELTERWVSPQRLVYYRDNWYLDAWCHTREDVRSFSVDHMNVAEVNGAARDIPDAELDDHFTKTYGIFAGPVTGKAVIRFSNTAARWVADEKWHPAQRSRVLPDGGWELTVPYGNPIELVMDILKYGPDAEVIAPAELRKMVVDKLRRSLKQYGVT